MLTNLTIRHFKRFEEVEIELGNPVVFIGPNNSGKTSAMQALALWDIGVKRWNERRSQQSAPERRPGVTVNRRDLLAIPVPNARSLWSGLHVRETLRDAQGQRTNNIRIDVVVDGITQARRWTCGLEFDYANEESFYCRPLRISPDNSDGRMPVPEESKDVKVAFLPPMSGLAATETRLDLGAVNVRIGEGRTAEVLRNLCARVHDEHPGEWEKLTAHIQDLFGAALDPPRQIVERGEIEMTCRERGIALDLSSTGRGLQQTLLILAYMYANPGTVLLLDEPDAHLEILRQRQTYRLIAQVAGESGSQIIAASHSEVILNEAAGRDMVVAFVGAPHRMDNRSQVLKALRDIGFDQYYQAEQTGWALYLEGSTDLSILQAFARRLGHDAARVLDRPFVHYVGNDRMAAVNHYFGLREALPNLECAALFDRLETGPPNFERMEFLTWRRREIENYFCTKKTLERFARQTAETDLAELPLLARQEANRRLDAMRHAIGQVESAMETLGQGSPWSADTKVSDHFLPNLFRVYYDLLDMPNLMNKKDFYELAEYVPEDEIDPEIREKLDAIARVAMNARPTGATDGGAL